MRATEPWRWKGSWLKYHKVTAEDPRAILDTIPSVLPRQWIGGWQDVDTDTGLAEILRRFLDTYGPATREDFARWFAMEPRPARQLFQRLADELVEVDVEGHAAWMTRDGAKHLAETEDAEVIRLLPGFDPYVVRAPPPRAPAPRPFRDRISRTSGWISPVLLIDGRIAGTWRARQP